MAGKKQPGRFTIQFSPADPQQRQVIELLNQQGRRKAVFLTAAVLSYCGKSAFPLEPFAQQFDLAAIEQVVRKVLREAPGAESSSGQVLRDTSVPLQADQTQPIEDQNMPDDVMNSISEMIDLFRK